MRKIKALALLLGFTVALTASADLVLLNYDGSSTAGWTTSAGTIALSVVDDAGGIGGGNALQFATTGKNNQFAELAFNQSVTLGVGDFLSVSLDYRFTTAPPNINFSTVFGFVANSTFSTTDQHAATYANLGVNGPTGNLSKFQINGDVNEGKFATIDSGTTAHDLTYTVTRLAGGQLEFNLQIDGTTVDATKTGSTVPSSYLFDSIRLGGTAWAGTGAGGGDGVEGFLYDNIVVTTSVPEPATLGMLGLGALLTLLIRRARS